MNKKYGESASTILGEIEQHKKEVEKLVGVIGNLGVTSGYLKSANKAKITVLVWQIITVGAMITLSGVAYYALIETIKNASGAAFSWPIFAGRVFVAITLGALAAYAGAEAARYQKVEHYNRRLALELEAIGPFIAPLSEEKQADFRIKIGERSFGQGEGKHSEPDTKSPTSIAEVIMNDPKFRALLIEIVKTAKPGL